MATLSVGWALCIIPTATISGSCHEGRWAGATEAPPERSWLSHAKHTHRSQDGHSYDTVISLWVSLGGGGRPEAGSHLSAQAAETPQVPSVLNMSTVTDGLIWPSPHTQIPFHRTPTPGGCHSEGQTVGRTGGTEPSLAWLHLQTRGHILPASP